MDLTPGMVIAGRYRVERKVGAGGMGEVWSGADLSVGTRVALKRLLPAASIEHEVIARFKREAVFLSKINSEHVARVIDFITDDRVGLVLVMDFIEGDPLSKILQQRSLSVEEAVDLGVDVVSALCDLHEAKIIHRDLKPGNIIMQPEHDGTYRAILVDFGVSRALSSGSEDEDMTNITRADMAVGTMEYMAPEQILNSRDVTETSDLYAVGAMLFRAVAGHHLFGDIYDVELAKKKLTTDPPPLRTGRGDRVARGLEQVIHRALQRKPKQRYERADLMLAELMSLRNLVYAMEAEMDLETTHMRPEQPSVPDQPRVSSEPVAPVVSPYVTSGSLGRVSLPTPRPSSSVSTASVVETTEKPRRRGVSVAVTAVLVLIALAGGVGLGSTWTQRKLAELTGSQPSAEPSPAVATAAPEPTATATAEVAPTATASADPDEPMEIETAIPAAKPAPAPLPTPRPVAQQPVIPKPKPPPTTTSPVATSEAALPSSTATSAPTAMPQPISSSTTTVPKATATPKATSTQSPAPPAPTDQIF